jgi:sulfur carrier protein ThiS adenylyltransferase
MVDISKLSKDEYIKEFLSRQPVEKTNVLKNACVGIAGAGGLGSVVAENLARAGVGKLVIADFDKIEPSNLNRQRFSISQMGMVKVEALCQNIKGFNPFTLIVTKNEKVTASNCTEIFKGCEVVAECFDRADEKAMLVSSLRKHLPEAYVVTVSGIAGTETGSKIELKKLSDKLYMIGDMESDSESGIGLFASRVGIAASMQAHLILRILLGEEK